MTLIRKIPGYPKEDWGQDPTVTEGLRLIAETDETVDDVTTALNEWLTANPIYIFLPLQRFTFEHVPGAVNVWQSEIKYGLTQRPSTDNDPEEDWMLNPVSRRITQALSVISRNTPPGYDPTPSDGALGLKPTGEVEGEDIWDFEERFVLKTWITKSAFTAALRANFRKFARSFNDRVWKGFKKGEVKILSARITGKAAGDDDVLYQVTSEFLISETIYAPGSTETLPDGTVVPMPGPGVIIGDITPFQKYGHDLSDIRHAELPDPITRLTMSRPVQSNVFRVYKPMNYAYLGFGV